MSTDLRPTLRPAEQHEAHSHAERHAREAHALALVATSLTAEHPGRSTMDVIAEAVLGATSAHACGVIALDLASGRLHMAGAAGLAPGYVEAVDAAWAAGATTTSQDALRTGEIATVQTARQRMLGDPAYAPLHRFLHDVDWEAVVVVPLLVQGRPVGTLNVCYPPDREPDQDEFAFLRLVAHLAAVAVDNVRLHRELDRRGRENEALSRIAARWQFDQPLDLTFGSLAERLVEGTDAVACAVVLRQGEGTLPTVVGGFGLPESYAADVEAGWQSGARGAMHKTLETGEIQVLRAAPSRILDEPRYAPIHQYWQDAAWDTIAMVPLKIRGRILGAFACYYPRGVEPDQAELELLSAVADQASIAVENGRLLAQSELRVRELEAIARIASNFTFQQSLESMMDEVSAAIVQASGSARSCLVATSDVTTALISRVIGAHGLPEGYRDVLETAWRTAGTPVISQGLRTHETQVVDLDTLLRKPGYEAARAGQAGSGWQMIAVVPTVYHGEANGVLVVTYPDQEPPDTAEVAFLEAIADQTAVAIENARLFEQAQYAAVGEERQRLSRELHDSVSQALYGISLGAQTARGMLTRDVAKAGEALDYVLSLAEAGMAEMRALIFELRPDALAAEGLVSALTKQAASTRTRHAMGVLLDFDEEPDIPLAWKETLYRITQEALHNIVKHANASEVQLALRLQEGQLVLTVADNGRGFQVADDYPGHLGLKSMRERARRFGGDAAIESAPGAGCTIRVTLPLSG